MHEICSKALVLQNNYHRMHKIMFIKPFVIFPDPSPMLHEPKSEYHCYQKRETK